MRMITLILVVIFSIATINAQVTIIQSPFDFSQKVGETKSYVLTINNTYNFDIYDIKFSNLSGLGFSFPLNSTIPKNSTTDINFTLSPSQSISESRTSNVEFRFLATIPTEITTYNINVTNTGFSTRYLIIRVGDTIVWTNKDNIFHNLFSSKFSQNINPNETFSYTFSEIGTYNYQDSGWAEFNNFRGTIEVINRTSQEKVHNPLYDFVWNVGLNFFLNPTNLTFELLDDSFEISATGSSEGIIRIKNVGTETAERIKINSSSNWITFEENNFDLIVNSQNLVTYKISPVIFNTNDTNKTYTIDFTVKGSNTETMTKSISVFIPYTQVFVDTSTDAGFLVWFAEVYCKAHPNLFLCNPNQTIITNGNGSDSYLSLNISAKDFYDQKREIGNVTTSVIRLQNDYSLLNDKIGIVNTISNISNLSLEYQKERDRISKRDSNLRTIFFLFIFLGILSYASFKTYRKYREKKGLIEGAYEYRR
jgi:plastocyanin